MLITPLERDSKFVHSAFVNGWLYVVNKRPLTELCAPLASRILIANSCTRWPGIFKEKLSQDWKREHFSYYL